MCISFRGFSCWPFLGHFCFHFVYSSLSLCLYYLFARKKEIKKIRRPFFFFFFQKEQKQSPKSLESFATIVALHPPFKRLLTFFYVLKGVPQNFENPRTSLPRHHLYDVMTIIRVRGRKNTQWRRPTKTGYTFYFLFCHLSNHLWAFEHVRVTCVCCI